MEPSFRQLYEEHFRFVWRSLHRLGVREDDVPDAVQEVFVVVHRRLAEFEARSKMTTWLFGICMRVASDHRRSAAVRREIPTEGAVLDAAESGADDAAAQADVRKRRELLYRILDELPEEQRAVFILFELEGLSGDAIGELMGIPVGTVRSRLRLAREGFRRALTRLQAQARTMEEA
jgi:RNA polymerase sigma-70 factor, ECF subfamily